MTIDVHAYGLSPAGAELPAADTAGREKRRVALSSVLAATVLTAIKLVVGVLTGSLGLLSEALHSLLDLLAAGITCLAVHASDKPADAEHHYGHGKVENLSALVETLLLLVTCGWIVYEAVERLFFRPRPVEATVWSFAVIIVSIVVDVSRSRALMRVARRHHSQALEADALHFGTDVWSSAVVLVGLALVAVGQATGHARLLERADSLAALAVAVIVVRVSLQLARRTTDALLDRAPDGLAPELETLVAEVPGVLACRRLRLRQVGHQAFIDLAVEADRANTLEQGHAIAMAVEDAIRGRLPEADVLVHVDPARPRRSRRAPRRERRHRRAGGRATRPGQPLGPRRRPPRRGAPATTEVRTAWSR